MRLSLRPNLDLLKKYDIKLSALIITHSHEDHIGAVCDLIEDMSCPIYCTTFAKNFLYEDAKEPKFRGQGIKFDIKEISLDKQRIFEIGPFKIEMVRVTHSIVEATSLYITTDKGKDQTKPAHI
jgi:ribonuclease J